MRYERINDLDNLNRWVRKVYTDDGALAGMVAEVNMDAASDEIGRTLFVADAHDWYGEAEGYSPICTGVYLDSESALAEIERRAQGSFR